VQHSGFLSSSTKYWRPPLFGCLPLLINYICNYPPHLEAVPYIFSLMKCCIMLPRGDNSWWFAEAALTSNRKLRNCVRFSNVTCEMELNVECDSTSTGGTFSPWLWQVLLYCLHFFFWCLEVEGCRYVPELVTAYHVTWGTSVDCCVMIILVECVLCLQFKKRQ